jgi:ribosomal protein L22
VAVATVTPTVRAQAKWVRTSARKARVVAEHIRGRSVPEARAVLAFTPRAAARDIERVLASAVANAESRDDLRWRGEELFVASVLVDDGPTLKRWRARARGRVARIKKRTCHITIGLASPTGEEIPAPIERPAPVTLTEEPEPIVVDETGAEVEAVEEPAAEEAPAEEKPKRTRAPRKKAEEPAAPEAEVEEAPKPKRRRAAKPKEEAETAAAESETRPKTTRKKKTDEDEGSES